MDRFMLLFVVFYLVAVRSNKATATLTTSYVDRPCPEEVVTLTCTVSATSLQWQVPDGTVITISTLTTTEEIRGAFTAARVDHNDTSLSSSLTTMAVGIVTVGCREQGVTVGSVTIMTAVSPSPPVNVRHSVQSSTTDEAVVSVQWDPPDNNGGRDDLNYTVSISPPTTQLSATVVTSTTVTVTADYNEDYTINIVASNCAGKSTAVEYNFTDDCPTPTAPFNGVISRPVGLSVTFRCDPGFMPTGTMIATCMDTLMWVPDPSKFECSLAPPILCGLPQSPVNGSLGIHLPSSPLGTTVTFQCDDGLFPTDVRTATCRDMSGRGEWEPNPAQVVCKVTCSLFTPPLNGEVLDVNTIEGSVITFQCDPGFSPEGEMTATCNNSGLWDPDPTELECQKIEALLACSSAAVSISVVVSSFVSVVLGISVGLVLMYLFIHNHKAVCQTENIPPPPQEQPPPPGPVYEEVSTPKENIELETNLAYGPVGH